MLIVSVNKTQFSALNDKRLYFFDGMFSLPFGHFLFEEAIHEKKNLYKSVHQIIPEKKYDILKPEALNICQCKKLPVLRSILAEPTIL